MPDNTNDHLKNSDAPIRLWMSDEAGKLHNIMTVNAQKTDYDLAETVKRMFITVIPAGMAAHREIRITDNLDQCLFHSIGIRVIFPPPDVKLGDAVRTHFSGLEDDPFPEHI